MIKGFLKGLLECLKIILFSHTVTYILLFSFGSCVSLVASNWLFYLFFCLAILFYLRLFLTFIDVVFRFDLLDKISDKKIIDYFKGEEIC